MLNSNSVVDSIMGKIMDVILIVLKSITSFILSSRWITVLFWIVAINLVAIFLMKKDKANAENGARRIRESTLLSTALAGGALGMYYAMYKYKHKTLHKKFTIFVPLCITFHFACITFSVMNSLAL